MDDIISIDEDESLSPPKVKKPRISDVWKYFKKKDTKAKCTYCEKEYAHCGNTSNLKDHMSRCDGIRSSMRSNATTSSSSTTSSTASSSQSTLDFFIKIAPRYDQNSSRKKEIDCALALSVCQDYQPFSIVNDEGFRNFVRVLDTRYELPCKTTLKNKLLKSQYDEIKIQIKNELESVAHIAITCDIWSSRANDGYLTVTSHFITKDFDLKCYVLSTKPLLDRTNKQADNITRTMQSVFDEYQITNKIVCIVTDNDSTMIKMCSNLQKRHLPCMAHTINLIIKDTLKLNSIESIISKCKNIVRFFKSSNIATEKLKEKQNCNEPLKLIQEVPTRWNSSLAMIKRIMDLKNSVNTCLLGLDRAPEPLRNEEALVLNDLVLILTPFEEATRQLSSSSNVTVSLINPLICGIFVSLNDIQKKLVTEEGGVVANFIITRMQVRLASYESRTVTRISTLLDARFKKDGFRQESNAEEALKLLDSEIVIESIHMKRHSNDEVNENDTNSKEESSNTLLYFLAQRRQRKNRTTNVDAIITRRQYLELENCDGDTNPLLYWEANAKPKDVLAQLARKYLSIPSSSVESERVFSTAGLIVNDRRSSLKPETVDMLVFLHTNLCSTKISKLE